MLAVVALLVTLSRCLPARPWGGAEAAPPGTHAVALDSAARAEWTRANPWLFRDDSLAVFRDRLLVPFALSQGAGPRAVRRRGDVVEVTVPRGRPVHVVALDWERASARAGFMVTEGRELGNAADRVEYRIRDAAGRTRVVRFVLGSELPDGAFRMALVVTDIGRATAADRLAWLEFPHAVTLVYPDTLDGPGRRASDGPGLDVLVELPMEPSAYPYVRPGPRALFIHHGRDDIERILRDRIDAHPRAAGFATLHGDRAIENGVLMENVLGFVAARQLIFLDLTASPRSLTTHLALRTGADAVVASVLDAGTGKGADKVLAAELDRRAALARRTGEGVWVVRHEDGLPARLARIIAAQAASGQPAPRWVTLREFRRE